MMFVFTGAARFALAAAFVLLLNSNTLLVNADLTISDRPWLDKSRPAEERLQLFMLQLNTTQKYAMVQGDTVLDDHGTGISACIGHISGNDTLGVPSVCMGDGPAGVGNNLDNVTTFPAPVVAASSWNTSLQYAYGQALAQEHKSKGRNVVLAPTINILRSPAWGRAAETLSEDPYLTSRMAVAGTLGIQSQEMLACPKHFAAYNQETNRFGVDPEWDAWDSVVDERVLHELYFPAFKATVQDANAACIMCSYNKLNGEYACENSWLLNDVLKEDWGFNGYVVADWYFSTRSTVGAVMGGLDISMPGGSFEDSYGFPAYYGDLLIEAVNNGTIPFSRIDDMVARLWRPMFELGAIDAPVLGNSSAVARTQGHVDLAQQMAEEGSVLLKNEDSVLPLSTEKYSSIAIFGADSTELAQVTENHGGFVIDKTMVVKDPLSAIKARGQLENITVAYSEAYPGTQQFPTIPSSMFGQGVNVTYWTTTDFTGLINQTQILPNITAPSFPSELWISYPQVFSATYDATFSPNTTGIYHFSLTGQGTATLYIAGKLIANMTAANFGNTVQGIANLTAGIDVPLHMAYSMGDSLSTGAYGITLGVSVGNVTRDTDADSLASTSDISIIFVSDRHSEGLDNWSGLSLPGDQDALISRLAKRSRKTVVVLNTNSAILMPWIDEVDAVLEAWYGGQQIGLAIERLLFGDANPSGKLPMTFPKTLDDSVQISGEVEVPYEEGLYVGYKWFDERGIEPLFPFGHGLSYTSFEVSNISVAISNSGNWSITAQSIIVTTLLSNTGSVAGKEVVQLYVSYPAAANEPPKLLKGYEKVYLGPGDSSVVTFGIDSEDLRIWDGGWKLVPGNYTFLVGFSAGDIRLNETITLP
ncbi:glycoside hydrolase family 3 domain-containing protein [Cadophora sp. MPI-SDFR-AT-0126]|nr:glycoside hydrolase family 3 domain-containing protein [Leotiomycetes sp. MPI-SDFR-AT-0126]